MKKLIVFLWVVTASLAWAGPVFVEPPTTAPSDVDPLTLVELVRSGITAAGFTPTDNAEAADCALRPSVIRLGTAYIFSVDKIEKGKVTRTSKLKAQQIEELDEVAQRVVRAVLLEHDSSKDAHVNDVTEHEAQEGLRRKPTRSGSVVAVGPGVFDNLHSPGIVFFLSLGHGWGIGPLTIGWKTNFAINPNANSGTGIFADLNLNLTYYPLDTDTSPFVSGEFGYGLVRDGETGSLFGGMTIGGAAGIALLRTYQTHLEIGVHLGALVNSGLTENPLIASLFIGASF